MTSILLLLFSPRRSHTEGNYIPLWPFCKNVRLCCICKAISRFTTKNFSKHINWIVDRTDLRTFRRDGMMQEVSLISSSATLREGDISPTAAVSCCFKLLVFPTQFSSLCLFLAAECQIIDLSTMRWLEKRNIVDVSVYLILV